MVSIAASAATAPHAAGCHLPRSMSPGLNCPVTVVYWRLLSSQRCSGMATAMMMSVRLARAVAEP